MSAERDSALMLVRQQRNAAIVPVTLEFTRDDLATLTEIHREARERLKQVDSDTRRLGHLLLEFGECLDELRKQLV
jgi:hypothetical protein